MVSWPCVSQNVDGEPVAARRPNSRSDGDRRLARPPASRRPRSSSPDQPASASRVSSVKSPTGPAHTTGPCIGSSARGRRRRSRSERSRHCSPTDRMTRRRSRSSPAPAGCSPATPAHRRRCWWWTTRSDSMPARPRWSIRWSRAGSARSWRRCAPVSRRRTRSRRSGPVGSLSASNSTDCHRSRSAISSPPCWAALWTARPSGASGSPAGETCSI